MSLFLQFSAFTLQNPNRDFVCFQGVRLCKAGDIVCSTRDKCMGMWITRVEACHRCMQFVQGTLH